MKKIFWLSTVGLIALGIGAPASAADLAARPYTKAPPPMAAPSRQKCRPMGSGLRFALSANQVDAMTQLWVAPPPADDNPMNAADWNRCYLGSRLGFCC